MLSIDSTVGFLLVAQFHLFGRRDRNFDLDQCCTNRPRSPFLGQKNPSKICSKTSVGNLSVHTAGPKNDWSFCRYLSVVWILVLPRSLCVVWNVVAHLSLIHSSCGDGSHCVSSLKWTESYRGEPGLWGSCSVYAFVHVSVFYMWCREGVLGE